MKKTTFSSFKKHFFKLFVASFWCGFVLTGWSQQVTVTYNTPGSYSTGFPCSAVNITGQTWGGGGGGGGAKTVTFVSGVGGGGGGGAMALKNFGGADATSLSLSVGTGGSGGYYNTSLGDANGTSGGSSQITYKSIPVTANGGNGGFSGAATTQPGAAGGTYSGGDSGDNGINGAGSSGGNGGGTTGTGASATSSGNNGAAGSAPGGGGAGGNSPSIALLSERTGGNGGNGRVIISFSFVLPQISGTNTYCSGETLQLSVNNTCGSLTYTWYRDGAIVGTGTTLSLNDITTADAGNYTVRTSNIGSYPFTGSSTHTLNSVPAGITWDAGGLTGTLTSNQFAVTVHPASNGGTLSAAQAICTGDTPSGLTLTGYTGDIIEWQYSNDNFDLDINTISNTNNTLTSAQMGALSANRYYRVKVQYGSCTEAYSPSVLITVNPLPVADIINNTGTTVLTCATSSISLTATGGDSYLWDFGDANANVTVTAPGTYTVTVFSLNCTDTKSIIITEDKTPPPADITNNTGTAVLSFTTPGISLTATGGVSYSWNNGLDDNADVMVTAPGTYTVTVTGSNGCTAPQSITITADPPTITGPVSMTLIFGYAATSTGVYTTTGYFQPAVTKTSGDAAITWDNTTQQLNIAAGLAPGTYPFVLTASNGPALNATLTFILTVLPTYSVTYDANGGTGTQTDPNSPYLGGKKVTVLGVGNIAFASYIFTGWNTKPNGSGATYIQGNVFTINDDITLYAQWEYNYVYPVYQRLITVEPAANGRTVSDLMYARTGQTVTLSILPDPGYLLDSIVILQTVYKAAPIPAPKPVNVSGEGNIRTFAMPPHEVTVRATFNPDEPTANVETDNDPSLQAYVQDRVLYVSGLTAGESLYLYNLVGTLVYQDIAKSDTEKIQLPVRGIYIVTNGKKVLKIVN